jgi:malonyl-CoA/methylmalonyl-CoA synthetase
VLGEHCVPVSEKPAYTAEETIEMSRSSSLPLFDRAERYGTTTAVITREGRYSYRDLLDASARAANQLLDGAADLDETRVAFLVPPGFEHVATQWGIWRAGGVAVPLAIQHPTPELAYVIDDSQADAVVVHPDFEDRIRPVSEARSIRLLLTSSDFDHDPVPLPELASGRRAMIVYTSGTTGKPKGAVTTHANVQAQVEALVDAWEWSADDHILHVLPLHHVHGIVNVLTCALWAGAKCEFQPFDAKCVWQRFSRGDLTLFMAVPTIYAKLIAAWEQASPREQQMMSAACAKMRLMVSGSAALPVSTLQSWKSITGHVLLERYGMTEIGMALSNPLNGPRVPGHVGKPLPSVKVRRTDEQGNAVAAEVPGEIEVCGPGVFREYWGRPDVTREAFRDGWFRTGDVAVVEDDNYRILGRTSVDIIKTGGYKVSALEIEETLLEHSHIRESAVVGLPDPEWGECVSAALVLEPGRDLTSTELRDWAKQRLAVYKVPQRIVVVDELPRNAMGKVTKSAVKSLF